METNKRTVTAVTQLYRLVRARGPIRTTRVSTAHARGKASKYPYWGVADYEVRIAATGGLTLACVSRAGSTRRSLRLANQDARHHAESEGRLLCQELGRVNEVVAERILSLLGEVAS